MTDSELIRSVLAGGRDDYAELIRRYHVKVMGLCLLMLKNETDSDDAAQEIFIKAYRCLGQFKGNSSFSTWIYRIASNHCMDLLRKSSREKTDSIDAVEAALPGTPDAAVSLENTELARQALAQLNPEYRLILVLREIEGLSYEELTEALDCSLDSVKARLQRARASLEEAIRHLLSPQTSK